MKRFLILLFLLFFPLLACSYGTIPSDDNVYKNWGNSSVERFDQSRLRILVWNIFKAKREGFKEDFFNLSNEYDLILLQEFISDNFIEKFWNSLTAFRADYAVSFIRNGQSTGVATLSRAPIKSSSWIRSVPREPITGTPKMIIINNYEFGSHDLLVANIHGINFVSTYNFQQQLNQLKNAIKLHDGPMIVAGDFNTWNENRMKTLDKMCDMLKLTRVSFPGRYKYNTSELDHILVRGLVVKNPRILSNITTSDHFPLSIELSSK